MVRTPDNHVVWCVVYSLRLGVDVESGCGSGNLQCPFHSVGKLALDSSLPP